MLFDQGSTLVATLAAPLDKRDAIPGYTEDVSGKLPQDTTTLVWYTGYTNQNILAVLALWDA